MDFSTSYTLLNTFLFCTGLAILVKGSDYFVEATSFIARRFHVSEIIIGLSLVSIGTSLPELGVNIYAALTHQSEIALGNVVGSNITNLTLLLGVTVLIKGDIPIPKSFVKRDTVIMISCFVFFLLLCYPIPNLQNACLTLFDGLILLLLCFAYLTYLFYHNKQDILLHNEENTHRIKNPIQALLWFVIGLIMIFTGSKMAVDTVVATAIKFHISKVIISGTIIAFGTSVPELAVTITSVARKKYDLALGNVIGSCIFNIVLVMGCAVVISPIQLSSQMLYYILPFMMLSGLILMVFMWTGKKLVKYEAVFLLLLYIAFLFYNILHS